MAVDAGLCLDTVISYVCYLHTDIYFMLRTGYETVKQSHNFTATEPVVNKNLRCLRAKI